MAAKSVHLKKHSSTATLWQNQWDKEMGEEVEE